MENNEESLDAWMAIRQGKMSLENSLENNSHANLIRDVETMHANLYMDRHKECDMSGIYNQCIQEISGRCNVTPEYIHDYYIYRYKYDWVSNTDLSNEVPAFLRRQAE